ncbi:uncharacterized protein LOC116346726 [Contarinia nasturtii]|uniref:uncharacterized protein LOC116346726 n=1 Tax=Contarinia nasturtii TaxID=265458 RepID=UPI0012D3E262|nr:uncharacterized protein LOC116346726 [Contarinia nasturtii]
MAENTSSTTGTKLTDMGLDCLQRIFAFSSIDDLVNIAHANTKLRPAADYIFGRKIRGKRLTFRIMCTYPNELYPAKEVGEEIFIQDLQTALRLLRCFGHKISKMKLSYPRVMRRAPPKVLRHANEYCSALTDIAFHMIFKYAFGWSLQKPFLNVENIRFVNCKLSKKITRFNDFFPAMRYLHLVNVYLGKVKYAYQKYHNLEHLVIDTGRDLYTNMFETIRINPQLRNLSLHQKVPKYIRASSKYLTQLERLRLHVGLSDLDKFNVNFKTVKVLEIFYKNVGVMFGSIELTFDQLEEFILNLGNSVWHHQIINFLQKHQSIKKFTLFTHDNNVNEQILIGIVEASTQLKELNISGVIFPVDDIVRFVHSFQLFSYGFTVRYRYEVDHLKKRLGNDWITSAEDSIDIEVKIKRNVNRNIE